MPEFMLTSDASNANYASTMVAEGPAMRMFARLQAEQVADDVEVMSPRGGERRRGGPAAARGARRDRDHRRRPDARRARSNARGPAVPNRNANGILSPQTWSQRLGLDYEQEQANIAAHAGRSSPPVVGRQKPSEIDAGEMPLDVSGGKLPVLLNQ